MIKVSKFEEWNNVNESEELYEFLGLGKLVKAFVKSFSEPFRKKIEVLTKSIEDKTGKVKDATQLSSDLISTFKEISDDKKADLKGADDVDAIKDLLKDFIKEVKTVFSAAKVPYAAMLESEELDEDFFDLLNEKKKNKVKKPLDQKPADKPLDSPEKEEPKEPTKPAQNFKEDFKNLMTKVKTENFEDELSKFIDAWVESKGDDLKKLKSEAEKLITTMMDTFKKKVKSFGSARLEKLVALTIKNPDPKAEEVKSIMDEKPEKDEDEEEDGDRVETKDGQQEFIKAIENASDDRELKMYKTKNTDGSYDLTIKGIKLK